MRPTIVRTVISPLALAAIALVVVRADADPPSVACQSMAPHHTATLGPNVDSVSLGPSTLAYWNNDCGCYIAQVDVPSTSAPKPGSGLQKNFTFGGESKAWDGVSNKEDCAKMRERWYIYKKEGAEWKFKKGGDTGGYWRDNFGPAGCFPNQYEAGSYDPPTSGTDSYRILKSITDGGSKHLPVSAVARHPAIPPK